MNRNERWRIYSVTVDDRPNLDRPGLFEDEALEYYKKLRQDGHFGQWWVRWNDGSEAKMWDGKPLNDSE